MKSRYSYLKRKNGRWYMLYGMKLIGTTLVPRRRWRRVTAQQARFAKLQTDYVRLCAMAGR